MEPITRTYMDGTAYVHQNLISQNASGSWSGEPIQKLACYEGSHLEPFQVMLLQDLAIRYITLGSPESIRERLEEREKLPECIDQFKGKYRFLSNKFEVPVLMYDLKYGSADAAFHAGKHWRKEDQEKIAGCAPGRAAQQSKKLDIRSDWRQVKDAVMLEVVRQKFLQNMELKLKLLATGDAEIINGNSTHDNYWGHCICPECTERYKHNKLGKMLMQIRAEFRNILEPYICVDLPGGASLTAEASSDPERPGISIYLHSNDSGTFRVCGAKQLHGESGEFAMDIGCNESL